MVALTEELGKELQQARLEATEENKRNQNLITELEVKTYFWVAIIIEFAFWGVYVTDLLVISTKAYSPGPLGKTGLDQKRLLHHVGKI